jgi:hypothetical protein
VSELPPEDAPSPAEQRLLALLLLLRRELDDSQGPPVSAVMRRVRVQRVLRDLLGAMTHLAAAAVEGVGLVLGWPRRRQRT